MIDGFRRARRYLQAHGARSTADKIVRKTLHYAVTTPRRLKYQAFVSRLKGRDLGSIFTEIYERNIWESAESRSGIGSETVATENIRRQLPQVIEKFSIRRILDAPCGDFNWMRLVRLPSEVTYTGWDIVPAIVERNRALYGDAQHGFQVGDITRDPLPPADLMICRDCLFHLSHADIGLALRNFLASGIPFLFTTTHIDTDATTNGDIPTGYFRRIDLFAPPFRFPTDVLHRLDDYGPGQLAREICLWNRSQVAVAAGHLAGFGRGNRGP